MTPVQAGLNAAAQAAPAVLDAVKKKAPAYYQRAKQFFEDKGSDIALASQHAKGGDVKIGAAILESMIDPSKTIDQQADLIRAMASAVPGLSQAQMAEIARQLKAIRGQEESNAQKHHGVIAAPDSVRIAELSRLISRARAILGVTEKELRELLVIFANVGPEDVDSLRAFKAHAGFI